MNIINKLMTFIKNIFNKKEKTKELDAPTPVITNEKKGEFIKSLKINTENRKKEKKVETLICEGDGLGIQKNIRS